MKFCSFLFMFTKWFILKNLKILVTHLHHHWPEHFIAKKHRNKMRKKIFCFDQIINLKKTKKYRLQKSIIRVYTSNHRQIKMFFCDQKFQFVEMLKCCDDYFYQTYWTYFWLNKTDIWKTRNSLFFSIAIWWRVKCDFKKLYNLCENKVCEKITMMSLK